MRGDRANYGKGSNRYTVRFNDAEDAALRLAASSKGESVQDLIRRAVMEAMKHLDTP